MFLYLTADTVGIETGGGVVTQNEFNALDELSDDESFALWSRQELETWRQQDPERYGRDPWCWDNVANEMLTHFLANNSPPRLCHVYAGTFTQTVARLKSVGCKVTYTAAAHDVEASKREHEQLKIPFDHPHLTDPGQFRQYVGGYLNADKLICPSTHSANVMKGFGREDEIAIVPHGVNLPASVKPLPSRFTVGYLGSFGPDKGVRYLLEAWKRLNYKDATLLLAGRDSSSPWGRFLIQQFGGGSIATLGWVKDVSHFYDQLSLYVQPSVTEGFGIEVLEALAHGRSVLCSSGAGACDVLRYESPLHQVIPGNVDALAHRIHWHKIDPVVSAVDGRRIAEDFTWGKVRKQYQDVWSSLLKG